MKQNFIFMLIFAVAFGISSTFQNCANQNFANPTQEKSNALPVDHPSFETMGTGSANTVALLDRKGIESALQEVFINEGVTESEKTAFNNLFATEILMQQHMFGRPCDVMAAGSTLDCGYNLGNLTLGMSQASSTVREASRIQLCRRLTARDGLLLPLLERLGVQGQAPNAESLQRAVQLFYPAWEKSTVVINALQVLDYQMVIGGEPLKNRWAVMINTLCESPFWEVL